MVQATTHESSALTGIPSAPVEMPFAQRTPSVRMDYRRRNSGPFNFEAGSNTGTTTYLARRFEPSSRPPYVDRGIASMRASGPKPNHLTDPVTDPVPRRIYDSNPTAAGRSINSPNEPTTRPRQQNYKSNPTAASRPKNSPNEPTTKPRQQLYQSNPTATGHANPPAADLPNEPDHRP